MRFQSFCCQVEFQLCILMIYENYHKMVGFYFSYIRKNIRLRNFDNQIYRGSFCFMVRTITKWLLGTFSTRTPKIHFIIFYFYCYWSVNFFHNSLLFCQIEKTIYNTKILFAGVSLVEVILNKIAPWI